MVIAVNTRFLLPEFKDGYGFFIQEVFSRLARRHPEHQFYFLFDRPFQQQMVLPGNVTPLVVGPSARSPLLWRYWYDFKVPRALKKIKADVFVSPDGFCSLTTKVPQCLVVHDLGFLHVQEGAKKSHLSFYRRYTPKFLKKAATIAAVSEFLKQDLVRQYKMDPGKIRVVYSAVKEGFVPTGLEEQQAIKEKFTDGREYFIYTGDLQPRNNLVNLLKAFSVFKKRQKSGMKLVLASQEAPQDNAFLQLLSTYKYRDEVVLLNAVDQKELQDLVGAAYALVDPSFYEGFGVAVLEAMSCGVPALTSKDSAMQEMGEEAALYFDPHNSADMAEQLMLIYKDENLRSRLIEKGKESAKKYSWQHTTDGVWQSITEAVKR